LPECITYLENDMIFIGSRLGDSQLIKLQHTNPVNLSVMETFANAAPIIDMVVLDYDKQGPGQIVTCSGT
jgi:DNA damage-binding protein 1